LDFGLLRLRLEIPDDVCISASSKLQKASAEANRHLIVVNGKRAGVVEDGIDQGSEHHLKTERDGPGFRGRASTLAATAAVRFRSDAIGAAELARQ
jgi:hypothetical protein